MFESMTIELGLDEHHRLSAAGERAATRPQPPSRPTGTGRRVVVATLIAITARLDPALAGQPVSPNPPLVPPATV